MCIASLILSEKSHLLGCSSHVYTMCLLSSLISKRSEIVLVLLVNMHRYPTGISNIQYALPFSQFPPLILYSGVTVLLCGIN